jgi:hypothetical protein
MTTRIQFLGFAGDCTIHGHVDIDGGRLSDALNRSADIVVHDATLRSLDTGQQAAASDVAISMDDLFLVEADAPGGDEQRRIKTVRQLMRVEAGPYVVYGEMHALPGIGALRTFHSRRGLVPLTACHIMFFRGSRLEVIEASFALVNTRLVDDVDDKATPERYSDELQQRAAELASRALGSARSDPAVA